MKQVFFAAALAVSIASPLARAWSQSRTILKADDKRDAKPPPAMHVGVALGNMPLSPMSIVTKAGFDAAARAGLKIQDGAAGNAVIEGFTFTYAERNFYEDSIGNIMPVTDYLTEYCYGDTLNSTIRTTLFERTKPGDTAYFDLIKVRLTDGKVAVGKPLKFVITK